MGKKNKQRKESDNTVVNPLAPRKKNSLNPLDIEQGGGPAKSPLASLKGGGSKWKVVQKKFEDYKEAKDQQSLGGKRLISSLRDQLLDETGNPNPKKILLLRALQKKEQHNYDGFIDQIANEAFIWMSELFALLTPGATGHYHRICTYIFTLSCIFVYLFMVGDYGNTEEHPLPNKYDNSTAAERFKWIVTDRGDSALAFKADYLIKWGARYLPYIKERNEHWRWFSNMLLHEGASHCFTNMLMFFTLSYHLERKYGWWRVGFVIVLAGVGGNFVSAMFEDQCNVYVGFSGVCFGLFGLFVADIVLNYETVRKPKTKIILVGLFMLIMVAQIIMEGQTSHLSHVGGLLCGLLPSFAFLPNFSSERWEVMLPPLGILTILVTGGLFPPYVYYETMENLKCS